MRREDFADPPSYYLYLVAEQLKRGEREKENYKLITTGTDFDFLVEDYKGKKLVFPVRKTSPREKYEVDAIINSLDCEGLRLGRLCVWADRLDLSFVMFHVNRALRTALREGSDKIAELLEVEENLINIVRSFRVQDEEDLKLAEELKGLIEGISERVREELEGMNLDSREFMETFGGPLGDYVEPVKLYRFMNLDEAVGPDSSVLKALERELAIEIGLGPDFYIIKMKGIDVSDEEPELTRRAVTFTRQRIHIMSRYFGEGKLSVPQNSVVNATYLLYLSPSDWGGVIRLSRLFRRRRAFPF